ncbi:hypothetical protein H5410_001851 [Solanum commersonii]|uniref:Uncharacterized protein n=1 Tax=Solanum commersonii TaxID=4109 RepID=A0A9J6B079_SOLCO|nr:hypothetical protein H5410_001851 [Solanum commersonii]
MTAKKTCNDSGKQKDSNVEMSFFQQMPTGPTPSSASAPTPKNRVFNFGVYGLLDPGASLSFVTPYIAISFDILPEQLLDIFSVSTPMVWTGFMLVMPQLIGELE